MGVKLSAIVVESVRQLMAQNHANCAIIKSLYPVLLEIWRNLDTQWNPYGIVRWHVHGINL